MIYKLKPSIDVIKLLTVKPDKMGADGTYSTCNVNNLTTGDVFNDQLID